MGIAKQSFTACSSPGAPWTCRCSSFRRARSPKLLALPRWALPPRTVRRCRWVCGSATGLRALQWRHVPFRRQTAVRFTLG